jgi:hypothetical protein
VTTASSSVATKAASSTTGFKKRRKIRNKSSSSSLGGTLAAAGNSGGGGNLLPPRLLLQFRQFLQDEDMLVTMIQVISVVILLGCGITLILHYFGMGEWHENDDGNPSAQAISSSSWWNSMSMLTNWMFLPGGVLGRKRQRLANGLYTRMDMKPSSIYEIPNSLGFVGDKSDRYAQLRKEFDSKINEVPDVKQKYVFGAMPMNDPPHESLPEPYDIYNCPDHPPKNYPYAWNLLKVLKHWQPDDPTIPPDSKLFQGLCIFDYEHDFEKAVNYRRKELPFVVINDPQVKETVKRWNLPGYMEQLLGNVRHRAEYSESNHFLYWNRPRGVRSGHSKRRINANRDRNPMIAPEADGSNLENWKEPTVLMRMTYRDWLSHANLTESGAVVGPNDPHYYFRLIGCGETGPLGECDQGSSEYLFDELPFFVSE